MTTITIDATGHLEIPQEIRDQLGIQASQPLNLEVSNGCIILKPVQPTPALRRDGTALVLDTPNFGAVNTLIEDLREERILDQINP